MPTCTPWQTLPCVTALCALLQQCLGSGSWAATAEAASANNRLPEVNGAMQIILFVPFHLQSPPLKSRGQPLQYELSKSNVPTFQPATTAHSEVFSAESTNHSQPKHCPVQGCWECCGLSLGLNSFTRPRGSQSPNSPHWISLNCA